MEVTFVGLAEATLEITEVRAMAVLQLLTDIRKQLLQAGAFLHIDCDLIYSPEQ